MAPTDPTLEVEAALFAGGAPLVIGVDEVGRGAIAGIAAVGVCAILPETDAVPEGLRDSKLLSATRRRAVEPLVARWAMATAVGEAEPAEVDALGIVAALGLAGRRALISLFEQGVDVAAATVLLDGSHDWLTPALGAPPRILTRVKADRDCASVAGASIMAKQHRDALMVIDHERWPVYGWDGNKGYGSPAHLAAVAEHGASPRHRLTWLRSAEPAAGMLPFSV
ncbi:ribonuclease HII [Microcella daejeonensis]|uniref:ribonuclease HII n=1 Tax=Microcella daejeonensis TaxID=2994971 RepID=UPI0022712EA5|nr:ribonuclease HII [Microcella daejeonensis]WAB82880.1 ribonuclease HII [Microcella daejeonensis]